MVVVSMTQILLACDHLIEVGPGPGVNGGELLFSGNVDECILSDKTVSGNFLSGKESVQKRFSHKKNLLKKKFLQLKKPGQII